MEYTLGEVIYSNLLASQSDLEDFKVEGKAVVSFPKGKMRLENSLDSSEGQKANFILWCTKEFPGDISIEWEFCPIKEPGLAMIWFAAAGRKEEDLFDPNLNTRTGEYKQYYDGDINAYHLSYFRRKLDDERSFHTCNLRKSHGFHLVCQGADPIPDVTDITDPYHIQVIKYKGEISFYINHLLIFKWEDDNETYGDILQNGKIGFRQMAPLIAEYSNLVVRKVSKEIK